MNYSKNSKARHTSDDLDLGNLFDGPERELTQADMALLEGLDALIAELSDDPAVASKTVTAEEPDTPKQPSKRVTASPRSSDRKDQKTLRTIASFQLPACSPDSSPLVEAPLTPNSPSQSSLSAPLSPHNANPPTPHNDNHLPVWAKTRGRVKLAAANEAMEYLREPGMRPFSFSLNLTPGRISQALRDPKGFTDFFKRQIERDLKRACVALPYWWFAVDIERDRLHLHGGMLARITDLEAIWFALCRSGGDQIGPGARYQLDMKPRCDWGWGQYAIRNHGKVRRIIGDHTVSISRPLNATGEWLYGEYRRIMKAA